MLPKTPQAALWRGLRWGIAMGWAAYFFATCFSSSSTRRFRALIWALS